MCHRCFLCNRDTVYRGAVSPPEENFRSITPGNEANNGIVVLLFGITQVGGRWPKQ